MKKYTLIIAALLIFLAAFGMYVRSLNPVFHANDSPETSACAYTLGIQHPPGYPLPALLGKIFTLIPAGSIGFRVNLGAAFFAALAAVMLFLILTETFRPTAGNEKTAFFAAAAVALGFAFSPTFWAEALSSKGGIYTLNTFLMLFLTYVIFKWERTKQVKQLYLFSLIYGISLANHWESMAVAAPAFMIFVFLVLRKDGFYKTLKIKHLSFMAAFFVSGVMLYAYLLIRSKSAILNWGRPDTIGQLIQVILREQYADLEKARSLSVVYNQAARIVKLVLSEFSAVGLLLAAAGIFFAAKARNSARYIFFGALALTILAALAFYFNLKEEMLWIMDVFMIPVYAVMAVFIGLVLKIAMERIPKWRNAVSVIFFACLPLFMVGANFRHCDQSRYFYAYDFGMNIIKSIESPAIAFLDGDFNVMPQMYFKYVEKKTGFCPVTTLFLYKPWGVLNQLAECPDVKFTSGINDSFSDKLKNIVEQNYREKNIFVSIFRNSFQDFYPEGNRLLVPNGLVMKLTFDRKGTAQNAERNLKKLSYRGLLDEKQWQNSTTRLCVSNYSSACMELGNAFKDAGNFKKAFFYMNRAVMLANEKTKAQSYTHLAILYSLSGDNKTSVEIYKNAIAADPKLPEPYSNLAGIYNSMGLYDESIDYAEKAIKQKPVFPEAYNNMAIAYYNKGDKRKAAELMEKAVLLNPANEQAKKNLAIIKGEIK